MPTGRRRTLVLVLGAVVLLLVLFTALSGFYVDLLWYREVHLSTVFLKVVGTRGLLGIAFGLVFFALLYVNLLIVRRLKPPFQPVSLEQEMVERYRVALEPSLRWLLPLTAAVLALFVGIGAGSQWQSFLLWRNSSGVAFGTVDPQFHRDVGFYVFRLPWLHFVQGWLFSALVGVTVIVAIAHYLWGGIRPQAPGLSDKVTPQVKAHLSVLLGLIVLVKAWGYYLGRFDLLVSSRGVVTGASYTDVHAQLPALNLLMLIAVICAVLFLVNIRFRGWALPVIGVGLLALVSIVAGAAIPAAVQRLSVAPQELQRERPYIQRNIAATREAFALNEIHSQNHDVTTSLTPQDAQTNGDTISNIRLWRPSTLLDNFKSLQRIRQYYEFNDVDVDRYDLNGQTRMSMLSARQVSQLGIPTGGGTWQNEHLVYTHGYGAVSSLVNTATPEGAPVLTLRDIPPLGEPSLTGPGAQPRIYYGEGEDVPFVVVDTGAAELDYQGTAGNDQAQVTSRYAGEGGIPLGNLLQRAVFAYRFRDVNLLISGLIHSDSRIMLYRDIYERASRAVPFLHFDGDPYAAVVDGRIKWIWDAYTTTDLYPYSERVDLNDATRSSQHPSGTLAGTANYMRNSVKVVVDAYDGTLTYYVADPTDPIIRVWEKAFPDLLTPLSEAPASLRAHFRYPENYFQVQAEQFATYHVQDPDVFYGKQDRWSVPVDPTVASSGVTSAGVVPSSEQLTPYYVLMTLPGQTAQSFSLILPFTPQGRQNMVAWMAANSGPTNYGDITSFEFPTGRNVDGPQQVFARISNDPRFSAQQTLLNAGTSRVVYGDFLVIPVGNALIYVQPIYVASSEQNTSLPIELKRVVVVNGGRVGIGDDLDAALADSFVGQVPAGGGGGGGGAAGGGAQRTIQQLIQSALDHFTKANAALKAGDLAGYQSEINQAQQLLQRANDLAGRQTKSVGGGGSTAPTAAPTQGPSGAVPTPSASASP
jgi:uncharacterized protein